MKIHQIIKRATDAIEYSDSAEAFWALQDFEKNLNDPVLRSFTGSHRENFDSMIRNLKIVAFPHLEDEESAFVLQNYLLDFFKIEASLEPMLTEKLFLVPYSIRGELREKLKTAVLSNNQRLGNLTIGQWIGLFDKSFNYKNRDNSAVTRFLYQNQESQNLNIQEKETLKKILHAYDSLLVYTVPETGEDLEELKKIYLESGRISSRTESGNPSSFSAQELEHSGFSIRKINIREALKSFPNLGEQVITSAPLKLRSLGEPVRPSISNWLYDYTSHLGQTGHSTMNRTEFLFRSENARLLGSPEREKLGIILRSFDENTALDVDEDRQEVIFDRFSGINDQGSMIKDQYPKATPRTSIISHAQARPPAFNPPRPPVSENPIPKRETQTQPIQEKIQDTDQMHFVNPYPKPLTHEIASPEAPLNIANVRFSEGLPASSADKPSAPKKGFAGSAPKATAPKVFYPLKKQAPAESKPAPTPPVQPPTRQKNFIYPHYAQKSQGNPEPKIDGNVVDLSTNNDQ